MNKELVMEIGQKVRIKNDHMSAMDISVVVRGGSLGMVTIANERYIQVDYDGVVILQQPIDVEVIESK